MKQTANVTTELLDKIALYAKMVDKALSEELQNYLGSDFYEPLKYALEGGKRIRPIILLLSNKAAGGYEADALKEAVAIELLHTESIIHDDIIDDETIRRGKPVFYVVYGFNTSLLTADFVFGIILSIASKSKKNVAEDLASAALQMCEGEILEMKVEADDSEVPLEKYLLIVSKKTASLFEAAAKIGAKLASADEKVVEALSKYGFNIGIAYQIQDDILDWNNGSKIARRVKVGDGDARKTLAEIAAKYANEAKMNLKDLPDCEAKQILYDIADFAVNRLS
ncbi:MAG: polyprenyl synthetase family protein [Thaumarchaeota archaeon]|jgi:octaprenyl-diphosphate synthase|nr:polyprenyl synthetase family protein [Nitrososphaerota archaeon]